MCVKYQVIITSICAFFYTFALYLSDMIKPNLSSRLFMYSCLLGDKIKIIHS